jgi:hypothetical protein
MAWPPTTVEGLINWLEELDPSTPVDLDSSDAPVKIKVWVDVNDLD